MNFDATCSCGEEVPAAAGDHYSKMKYQWWVEYHCPVCGNSTAFDEQAFLPEDLHALMVATYGLYVIRVENVRIVSYVLAKNGVTGFLDTKKRRLSGTLNEMSYLKDILQKYKINNLEIEKAPY